MLREELKFDDGIVMEAVVEKFVKYFRLDHIPVLNAIELYSDEPKFTRT